MSKNQSQYSIAQKTPELESKLIIISAGPITNDTFT
jgi:hypothetical protein